MLFGTIFIFLVDRHTDEQKDREPTGQMLSHTDRQTDRHRHTHTHGRVCAGT